MKDEVSFDDDMKTLEELEGTFLKPKEEDPQDQEKRQVALYDVSVQQLEALRERALTLDCSTPERYDETRRMIGILRTSRTRIEKKRKEHNAEHQEAIRFVNGVAKQITQFIENLEEPLKQMKLEVDDAKERAKRKAEEEEAKRLADIERARLEAEEEERRAAHAAQEAKNAEEAKRLADERAALNAEREALAAEQRKLNAEREEAAQAERDRLAAIEAEKVAQRAKEESELLAAEQERRRQERLPDVDKMKAYGLAIISISPPEVQSPEAKALVSRVILDLSRIARHLELFS